MPSFGGLLIVTAVAFAAPFVLGLFPGLRLPSIVPVLEDAGESGSTLGQLVIAAGSIADFGAIVLLSVRGGDRDRAASSGRSTPRARPPRVRSRSRTRR